MRETSHDVEDRPYMNVLFVCTGNLCRSPMAEALLRAELAASGCDEIEVSSAGTWSGTGSRATPEAIRVVEALGGDLSGHRSQSLTGHLIRHADLIVAMTSVHVREISSTAPEAMSKVVLLKHLAEMQPEVPPEATREERLAALLGVKRPEWRRAHDVDDPMGLSFVAYERCAGELNAGVKHLVSVLCA